jgi:leucyl-tRNA synthetase
MELINELKSLDECRNDLKTYALERFAVMIAPLAPHLGEECWQLLGNEKSIYQTPVWFDVDKSALIEDKVNIAVQINGKLRATIEVPNNSDKETAGRVAKSDERIVKYIEGKEIVKEIFVPNKIFNIVVK